MNITVSDGIWPVMITPFTPSGAVDYSGLEALTNWYIEKGCDGLFAVCTSSEMTFLDEAERLAIARFVKDCSAGRLPVVATGFLSDYSENGAEKVKNMYATGVDAVVLLTNAFRDGGSDAVFMQNLEHFLKSVPEEIPLGLYECPFPYKRVLSPDAFRFCAQTGRFYFIKDTCCDPEQIRAKLAAAAGTALKLFNANSATLLDSLKNGCAGYCGIMANYHPQLYKWLFHHWETKPEKAELLQTILTISSFIEYPNYPMTAKSYLRQFENLPITDLCRKNNLQPAISSTNQLEIRQLRLLTQSLEAWLTDIGA